MSGAPTERFSDRAEGYSRHRPGYPREALAWALEGLGPADQLVAADIGAGTGISSRLLADFGLHVIAVEPNEAMRAKAMAHPRVRWSPGTGESTGLEGRSVDLVVCAQAFHWLEADRALVEFRRVLRPTTGSGAPCRCALIWNVHDDGYEIVRRYREIILRHAVSAPRSPWYSDAQCALVGAPGWSSYRVRAFGYEQVLDEEGLLGRALSSSYLPTAGPARAVLEDELRALHRDYAHDGVIQLPYRTEVHLADVAS